MENAIMVEKKFGMPPLVAAYYNRHFRGAPVLKAEPVKDGSGQAYFLLELHDQLTFFLKFDEGGNLIDKQIMREDKTNPIKPLFKTLTIRAAINARPGRKSRAVNTGNKSLAYLK